MYCLHGHTAVSRTVASDLQKMEKPSSDLSVEEGLLIGDRCVAKSSNYSFLFFRVQNQAYPQTPPTLFS